MTEISIQKFFKYTKTDLAKLIKKTQHYKTNDPREIKIIDHGTEMIKASTAEVQRIMKTYFKNHPLPKLK